MDEITNPLYVEHGSRHSQILVNASHDAPGFFCIKDDAENIEEYAALLDRRGVTEWAWTASQKREMLRSYGVKWDPDIRF